MDQTELVPEISSIKSDKDTFYKTLRPLAVISKFLGTFPLLHVFEDDGSKVKHSWLSPIHVWGLLMCITVIISFLNSCSSMQLRLGDTKEDTSLLIWLTLTFFMVSIRCSAQFIILHFTAPDFPNLLSALEEYHQITGASIIVPDKKPLLTRTFPVIRTFIILFLLMSISFVFFGHFNGNNIMFESWPATLSFMFANIWKELPMNVFVLICRYLTFRFQEIKNEVKFVRENSKGDTAKILEQLRLQHAALTRILSHVQKCFGLQLVVNLFFLFLDTVLQLFVFFVITSSQSAILLLLASYYFLMSLIMLIIVERMEETGTSLLREVTAFQLCSTSRDQQMQIQLFVVQLLVQPVKLSAAGFFVVNNGLICSLLGAVATYIVMLVQFTPYIDLHLANFTLPSLLR